MKNIITLSNILILFFGLVFTGVISGQGKTDNNIIYKVVINHEEQYSIWLADKEPPKGWENTKINGTQKECHQYIEEVWTDMRPLSIRKKNLTETSKYMVVINHEEQYSIWPATSDIPKGWKAAGLRGTLPQCTDHIKKVWTDMRPLSIRKQLRKRKR